MIRVEAGVIRHGEHGARVRMNHDGHAALRVETGDAGLEFRFDGRLDFRVDRQDDMVAVTGGAITLLGQPERLAPRVPNDRLHAVLAAQPVIALMLDAADAGSVRRDETDRRRRQFLHRVAAEGLAEGAETVDAGGANLLRLGLRDAALDDEEAAIPGGEEVGGDFGGVEFEDPGDGLSGDLRVGQDLRIGEDTRAERRRGDDSTPRVENQAAAGLDGDIGALLPVRLGGKAHALERLDVNQATDHRAKAQKRKADEEMFTDS